MIQAHEASEIRGLLLLFTPSPKTKENLVSIERKVSFSIMSIQVYNTNLLYPYVCELHNFKLEMTIYTYM